MHHLRIGIMAFLFLLTGLDASAQYKKISKNSAIKRVGKYACPVVRKTKATMGVGAKVGDPVGLTYKVYFLKRFGFETVLGYTTSGLYSVFIRDQFRADPQFDSLRYLGHRNRFSLSGQARVVIHNPLPEAISGEAGIDWYLGFGWNIRTLKIEYTFDTGDDNPVSYKVGKKTVTHVLYGPDVILGFEYVLPGLPIAAFAETGLFYDISTIQQFKFEGGMGFRYNF